MQLSSVKKAQSWMVAFLCASWDSIGATCKVCTPQNGKFWPLYPSLYSKLRFGLIHPYPCTNVWWYPSPISFPSSTPQSVHTLLTDLSFDILNTILLGMWTEISYDYSHKKKSKNEKNKRNMTRIKLLWILSTRTVLWNDENLSYHSEMGVENTLGE